jgi:hypothetical protein
VDRCRLRNVWEQLSSDISLSSVIKQQVGRVGTTIVSRGVGEGVLVFGNSQCLILLMSFVMLLWFILCNEYLATPSTTNHQSSDPQHYHL